MSHSFLAPAAMLILSLASVPATRPSQGPALEPPPDLIQANSVVQGFVHALRESDWAKALGYCSIRVQDDAKPYPSPEAFFRSIVPVEQVVTRTKNPIYRTKKSAKGSPWAIYALAYKVAELERDPAVTWTLTTATQVWWQGGVRKVDSHWVIDFPTTPLRSHIEKRLTELRRLREKTVAIERELEPKLRGVHTRLTALAEHFEANGYMPFRLELVNEGPAQLIFDKSRVGVNDSMIVKDDRGNLVSSLGRRIQTGMSHHPIDPGQTIVLLDRWDLRNQYRLTKPGRYTVQFRGGPMIAEADPHKTIQIHDLASNTPKTKPAAGKRSSRFFPSNIVEIEVVARRRIDWVAHRAHLCRTKTTQAAG